MEDVLVSKVVSIKRKRNSSCNIASTCWEKNAWKSFSNFEWENEGGRRRNSRPLTSRHLNHHLFIQCKQQEGETVDEFCSVLITLAGNCDLSDKERRSLDNVHVSSWPQ